MERFSAYKLEDVLNEDCELLRLLEIERRGTNTEMEADGG